MTTITERLAALEERDKDRPEVSTAEGLKDLYAALGVDVVDLAAASRSYLRTARLSPDQETVAVSLAARMVEIGIQIGRESPR